MELVKFKDDTVVTELKLVANYFNKAHKHLMRDIRQIITDLPLLNTEFIPYYYEDKQGKERPTYYLTQKGFSILVMGFRGGKALELKSKFYDEFEQLRKENYIKERLINEYEKCTYCISDICCKFKDLTPTEANLYLLGKGVIEKRASGYYPSLDYLDWCISATTYNFCNYVRYTPKGMEEIVKMLTTSGYKLREV